MGTKENGPKPKKNPLKWKDFSRYLKLVLMVIAEIILNKILIWQVPGHREQNKWRANKRPANKCPPSKIPGRTNY